MQVDVRVKDKIIKNRVEIIKTFRYELENYLLENADLVKWSSFNYNFCNHCAIGIAYLLNKKVKGYEFCAYESIFEHTDKSLIEGVIVGNKFNHAYVLGRNTKTNNHVLIDMERYPLWNNVIRDISTNSVKNGDFFIGEKEVTRSKHNLDTCLNEIDYLTGTVGKIMFDEVIARC